MYSSLSLVDIPFTYDYSNHLGDIPYCPPGYYKNLQSSSSSPASSSGGSNGNNKCVKNARRVIRRGFVALYCIQKWGKKNFSRRKFLRRYFRKYQTKNKYLPRKALRLFLRRALRRTKLASKVRRRLSKLKSV